jgi:hypothetical protein
MHHECYDWSGSQQGCTSKAVALCAYIYVAEREGKVAVVEVAMLVIAIVNGSVRVAEVEEATHTPVGARGGVVGTVVHSRSFHK